MSSMNNLNIPVQMFAITNTDGSMRPVRFRYESEDHSIITVNVSEVCAANEYHYCGVDTCSCICKSVSDDTERMFDVRYTYGTHKWILYKIIY